MESGKMAPPKNAPRDALVMAQILKDMGITEYEPRVINQMLEFAFRYVTSILDDAKIYSSHAKKPNVDADDVRLAIQCRADQSFTSPPPRDFLLDIARQKNQTPLPLIKPYAGPRLPPDRYCLTAPNYRLKSLIKKGPNQGRLVPRLSVGAVSSRPTTPSVATPQTASVPNKVVPPVSVTSQRFTVQIPPSQSTPVKPVPATTAVQNVLLNPSIIGPKNILITTNMVSSQNTANESNPLKRKHEDDDDNDTIIRIFSNESTLRMRWPKYWSFSFSISPSKEHPGPISFRMDWLDLLAVQGTLKSLQHHSSTASILRRSAFFTVQLSHPYMTTGKTIALTRQTFVGKVISLLLNMLSRLVITFLPRNKHLSISWLQSPSAVILETPKLKSDTVSTVSPSICHEVMGPDAMILVF